MKWTKMSRGAKALAVSMALGLGVSACSRDYTVAYLYTTTTNVNPGLINAYQVDYQLGSLTPLADSPIPSGGRNPVGLVVSTNSSYTTNNQQFVYVINHDDSDVVEYAIGTDGKLFQENTYNVVANSSNTIIGSLPVALAMDAQDKFLYIAFTYQNGYSASSTGPGGIAVFPINPDGTLGTAVTNTTVGTTSANPLPYFPVGNNPAGIAVTSATATTTPYVYVIDQETVSGAASGVILGFAQNTTTGALTPLSGGTVLNGFRAGSLPGGIAADPKGPYIFVTDESTNEVYSERVSATGVLTSVGGSLVSSGEPLGYATGALPEGVTVDPFGSFVYVANFTSGTVTGYTIGTGGVLAPAGSATQTGTGPNCVTVVPVLGASKYLYTSNNLAGTMSGMQITPQTGALTLVQGTPFAASALPTCTASALSGAQ